MESKYQLVFFSLLGTRGRILYENKIFDSAIEDVNEAIKLSRELKENFEPITKGHLARLFVLRATILYKNNRDRMIANAFPKDVANTCLKDVNEAISILELMKKSSPEVFNAETGCSDSSFPVLLPKWYKLLEGFKSQICTQEPILRQESTKFSMRFIIDIILAPFTFIYSIVTFSSYKKGADKNSLLLGINEATYSRLLDMCQEGGVPPGDAKHIIEVAYDSINYAVDNVSVSDKNLIRTQIILGTYKDLKKN